VPELVLVLVSLLPRKWAMLTTVAAR
jgi:hypothetical protein